MDPFPIFPRFNGLSIRKRDLVRPSRKHALKLVDLWLSSCYCPFN